MHSKDKCFVKPLSSIYLLRLILGRWVLLVVDPVTSFSVVPRTQRHFSAFNFVQQQQQPYLNTMVSLHGRVGFSSVRRSSVIGRVAVGGGMHHTVGERPPDPKSILSDAAALQEKVEMVRRHQGVSLFVLGFFVPVR
jgi:hypothetical protein